MFKKFILYLTAVTMLLTMLIPGTGAFAAMTDPDTQIEYDYIHGGVIVTEGSYTATSNGSAYLGFNSPNVKTPTEKRETEYINISGTTVSDDYKSEILCSLTENGKYFFTVIYKHSATAFNGTYDLYINGVSVVKDYKDYNHTKNQNIDSLYCSKIYKLAFVSSDASATYDMAPYSAVITTESDSIVLGGKDVRTTTSSSIVFGGFTAKLLSEMTVAEFLQNVTPSTGATVSFKRGGETLEETATLESGDIVSITSQNEKVTNEYAVSLSLPAVTSSVYKVSTQKVISDVYEYTPVSTFKNYLTVEEGWNITLKNGNDEVTEGVVTEDMTLCASNADGEEQIYTIDILAKKTKITTTTALPLTLPKSIQNTGAFRGNLVIELDSTVAHGYFTGPQKTDGTYNNAFYVTISNSIVKLGMYENVSKGTLTTDLASGGSLSVTFVVKPDTSDNKNKVDYYVNGDYTGTCSMNSIYANKWAKWRVHTNTTASAFMVEDLDAYLAAKKVNKINTETADKVSVDLAGADADTLYLAVYNGNELESLKFANLTDLNFNSNVLSIPSDVAGKTVKAFLWKKDLTPLDYVTIQQ